MRPAVLPLLCGLALAGGASAQTVATAQGREGELAAAERSATGSASAAAGAPLSTAQQIDAWLNEAPPSSLASRGGAGPDGPWSDAEATAETRFSRRVIPIDGPPIARTLADGRVHGEAGAEIGTLGYGGYGIVSGPLGPNGALQIGVSHYQGWGGGGYGGAHRWRGAPNGGVTGLSLSAAWAPGRRIPDAPVIYTPTAPATPAN